MDFDEKLKIRREGIAGITDELYAHYGYERAPPGVLPGDSPYNSAYIRKGLIWVNLDDATALLHPAAQNFCGMEIAVPVDLPVPENPSRLFSRWQSAGRQFLLREFPYFETHEGYKGRHRTYLLFITDTHKAAKNVDREVNFTASMIEPVLKTLNLSIQDKYEPCIAVQF